METPARLRAVRITASRPAVLALAIALLVLLAAGLLIAGPARGLRRDIAVQRSVVIDQYAATERQLEITKTQLQIATEQLEHARSQRATTDRMRELSERMLTLLEESLRLQRELAAIARETLQQVKEVNRKLPALKPQ